MLAEGLGGVAGSSSGRQHPGPRAPGQAPRSCSAHVPRRCLCHCKVALHAALQPRPLGRQLSSPTGPAAQGTRVVGSVRQPRRGAQCSATLLPEAPRRARRSRQLCPPCVLLGSASERGSALPSAQAMAALAPRPPRRCQLIRRAAGVSAVPAGPGQTSAIGRDTFPVPLLAQVKVGL